MSTYKKDIDAYQNVLDKLNNSFDTIKFDTPDEKCMVSDLIKEKLNSLKTIDEYCDYWHSRNNSDEEWEDPRL